MDQKACKWSTISDVAFHAAKSQAASLVFTISEARISLMTDASDTALGATLQQEADGHKQLFGFFSQFLSCAQRNYSTFDRELLAIYLSLKHFLYFLEGRRSPFTQTMLPSLTPFPLLLRMNQNNALASSNSFRS